MQPTAWVRVKVFVAVADLGSNLFLHDQPEFADISGIDRRVRLFVQTQFVVTYLRHRVNTMPPIRRRYASLQANALDADYCLETNVTVGSPAKITRLCRNPASVSCLAMVAEYSPELGMSATAI